MAVAIMVMIMIMIMVVMMVRVMIAVSAGMAVTAGEGQAGRCQRRSKNRFFEGHHHSPGGNTKSKRATARMVPACRVGAARLGRTSHRHVRVIASLTSGSADRIVGHLFPALNFLPKPYLS